MLEYLEVEQARYLPGVRIVLRRGSPNPWGETAKGVFMVKRIPFVGVSQYVGEPNLALRDWTGQTSAPCVVYNDEPPKLSWGPVLHLAERIQRDPPLLPEDIDDRIRMLGHCEELAGEDGLAWHRRRHAMLGWKSADGREVGPLPAANADRIRRKYAYSDAPDVAETSIRRMIEIVGAMARLAESAADKDKPYLIGGRVSALDIMWAGFCGLFVPLPDRLVRIAPEVRALYTIHEERVLRQVTPALLAHRDFMYMHHMELPSKL